MAKDPLHNFRRSVISRTRAVCRVVFLANSRLLASKRRLAAHPDPTATSSPKLCRGSQALVYMLLRFNLPVFAAPLANPQAVPRWGICAAPNGKACIRLDNDGNRRVWLSALSIEGQGCRQALSGGVTVLAGAWRQWTFDQPLATPGKPLRISATSESGPLNAEVNALPP